MCDAEWHRLGDDGWLEPLDGPSTEDPGFAAGRAEIHERYGVPTVTSEAEWPLMTIRHSCRESAEATWHLCKRFGREVDPHTDVERDGFFFVTYDLSEAVAKQRAVLGCKGDARV